ncbi:cobaltochelatase CobN subunit [Thermomonospora echinospora]|uniref:Cobaltochelatase CobN subunit n=1 Tax=Thermomonospora echinospora TaxID=1992 RepID=A0A1H6B773_9ACTN|nr:cobaltochelatase subunit CobN [Thermomonospora echinospora]SEG56067.1 cobaltochelatase CobN subunit [Thermomonospora echinospora]
MRVLLLSTADTELLAARAARAGYVTANPVRVEPTELPALTEGVDVVVVRLLGGRKTWPEGIEALRATGLPLVLLGGEADPDAELMALSTVPAGVAAEALDYLREGGVANLRELARFLSDTVLLTGEGFEPPVAMPSYGVHGERPWHDGRPTVGVVFYRAHELSGNTAFVETLCEAVERRGGNALPVFCGSLRGADQGLLDLLGRADALVATVLAAGGAVASAAGAGGDEDAWDAGALAALDVPVIQGLCLTTSRATWEASDAALSPMDAAMQVAIPEFDGRLISVPFSFKEEGPDGIPVYEADPERAARVAGIAVRHARLRHRPAAERRVAVVLSSYPTKHSRVGNAVGLDTPTSAVRLLRRMAEAGYDLGDDHTLWQDPGSGDALIHALIAAGGHDVEWLTEEQLRQAPARVPLKTYEQWFAALPDELREGIREHWGEPPGELYVDTSGESEDIVLAALRFGNVVLMIQPPRGFGENPIAIYHDPDLPPSHHYLAAYRWLDAEFGADAVIHLGKHGTLEWLPGKGLGLAAGCAPDAVLGDLPLVYPFIVNDPGEGTQAKRRGHATVVDHLVPPMARADTYGDLAKLEQLLDEYATVQALDPAKLPAVRAQIWTLIQAAQLHHDLHTEEMPGEEEFDDFLLHVDGYLCEIKDVQIRDGLHILGQAPEGEARVNLILAVLRATQVWGGQAGAFPGLRALLARMYDVDEKELLTEPGRRVHIRPGPDGEENPDTAPPGTIPVPYRLAVHHARWPEPPRTASDVVDILEGLARAVVEAMEEHDWDTSAPILDEVCGRVLEAPGQWMEDLLRFASGELVPRLAATSGEIDAVLHALDGGHVPAGPSGSPTRGLVNVLPTGRNFYSVDPKAIPSRNAWDVGVALADSLIKRHLDDTGEYPSSVGLTVWGTSAMRTQGDDIAEVLALIGCRPVWDDASRRVTGFEVVPLAELGRPRIDVTLRISGFFRDAFPHVIGLLDDAIAAVAALEEPTDRNYLRAHALEDQARHGDWRRATTRIFGSKPGVYGAGLLPLIDARNWRDDHDLAEVYAVWGGYAYGRGLDGRQARPDMEAAFRRISVAAKNADTREHDIVDSDDYFQYHGGMVAMVRSLTGANPAAYVGDSAVPDQVRTRTLAEETHRVFRARVVNPRWIAAMRRHGYKGAFELAATVDYLFGYDATAGVVDDWMYETLAKEYVFDAENREFMNRSNPWALRGITERLLEAADRGLWAEPDPAVLDRLRATYLELEGDLEAGQ